MDSRSVDNYLCVFAYLQEIIACHLHARARFDDMGGRKMAWHGMIPAWEYQFICGLAREKIEGRGKD